MNKYAAVTVDEGGGGGGGEGGGGGGGVGPRLHRYFGHHGSSLVLQ